MGKITESHLRKTVGICLWITSGAIIIAVVSVFFGLKVPGSFATGIQWIGSVWAGITLVAGMILCWRLPGASKWAAVVVELFILAAGVLLFGFQEAQRAAALPQARLELLRQTPEYLRLQENLALARSDLEQLISRTATIPGDFTTAARQLEAAKDEDRLQISEFSAQLATLERNAVGTQPLDPPDLFAMFGPGAAPFIQAAVLFLFCACNEALAMLLLHASHDLPHRARYPSRATARAAGLARVSRTAPPGLEDYLAAARALGKDKGVLAGYRQVAPSLGISETQARALLREGLSTGVIGPDRREIIRNDFH